eukprot:15348355-Ditylum_brightwellii.AAC.1
MVLVKICMIVTATKTMMMHLQSWDALKTQRGYCKKNWNLSQDVSISWAFHSLSLTYAHSINEQIVRHPTNGMSY